VFHGVSNHMPPPCSFLVERSKVKIDVIHMSLVDMIFVFLLTGWVLLACAMGQGRHLVSPLSKLKCLVLCSCLVWSCLEQDTLFAN
jgi:hypothetical protein